MMTTLLFAAACDDVEAMQYNGFNTNNNNNNNDNNNNNNNNNEGNNNWHIYRDNIADSWQHNDNYDYADDRDLSTSKWQQKLYGNPQTRQQQQQQQQQQLRQLRQQQQQGVEQQFVDDPEAASNDFLLQLPDLNAAMAMSGARRDLLARQDYNQDRQDNQENNNNNNGIDNDNDNGNNVWTGQTHLQQRRSSNSNINYNQRRGTVSNPFRAAGQPEEQDDSIDIEGEEDYAVARAGEDADELSDQLPYGIQNVRKRRVRSVMPPPLHNTAQEGVTYQSLCPTKRVTVKLDNGEYRPNHYVEVTCANNYAPLPPKLHNYENYNNYRSNELPLLRALLQERPGEKREICSATGFSCIQLNRTIHLIRLNEGSGCWESETRTVPSGCECMWPKHSYGDIASYHQAQKRFSNSLAQLRARANANIDYTPGVGYRQLTLPRRASKSGGGEGPTRSRRDDLDYENY